MKIDYDKIADAVYIRAHKGTTAKTKKFDANLIVDFDAKGNVRGVEILNASEWLFENKKIPSIQIGAKRISIRA